MAIGEKSQSFRENADDISAVVQDGFKSFPSLAGDFDTARDVLAMTEKLVQEAIDRDKAAADHQRDLDADLMVRTGAVTREQLSTTFALASAQRVQVNQALEKDREASHRTALLLAMLDQIEDQIREMEAQIASMEAEFADLYGETWREDLAHEILDEVPQQRPGESLDDYRERVEQAVLDEMIDPVTGKVKDEYKNHPDQRIRHVAQWAQKQYDTSEMQAVVDIHNDPNATEAEKRQSREKYKQTDYYQEALLARNALEGNTEEQIKIEKVSDEARDTVLTEKVAVSEADQILSANPWG